jgi:hypothetical protein
MGVTIHYSGALANAAKAEALLKQASLLAAKLNWDFEIADTPNARIAIYPHPDCEPLTFDPDENGLLENWVKTQFAGPETHIQIVGFLAQIAPYFVNLIVEDEAEYWESRNREILEGHINQINEVLRDMQQENPAARIQVREPTGRIVDMIN